MHPGTGSVAGTRGAGGGGGGRRRDPAVYGCGITTTLHRSTGVSALHVHACDYTTGTARSDPPSPTFESLRETSDRPAMGDRTARAPSPRRARSARESATGPCRGAPPEPAFFSLRILK
ncbi:hypothetical protein EVAR_72696_1, partial [Eumeta japonica]